MAAKTDFLELRVRSITNEARGINTYELVDVAGRDLPPFTAGAHLDLHLPGGYIRQYSLCNDPAERHRYVVGVLRQPNGRGGSESLHRAVRAGDIVKIAAPRNNFPLAGEAQRHLLIAGGIGVTPMMAMIAQLTADGAAFVLHYCTRDREVTAFAEQLAPYAACGEVVHHFDGGDPSRGLDVTALLKEPEPGTHLYYCGPDGLMRAVAQAAAHWPTANVHCEYFTPPVAAASAGDEAGREAFEVKLASSGEVFTVPKDKSIAEVLRENGVEVEVSCEAGLCGTCRTRYLAGEPEHNDFVLSEDEQGEFVMVCSARSRSAQLVLDL